MTTSSWADEVDETVRTRFLIDDSTLYSLGKQAFAKKSGGRVYEDTRARMDNGALIHTASQIVSRSQLFSFDPQVINKSIRYAQSITVAVASRYAHVWNEVKQVSFNVKLVENTVTIAKNGSIVAKNNLHREIRDIVTQQEDVTIVLIGASSSSHVDQIKFALEKGFRVCVFVWQETNIKQLCKFLQDFERFELHHLDDHLQSFMFIEYSSTMNPRDAFYSIKLTSFPSTEKSQAMSHVKKLVEPHWPIMVNFANFDKGYAHIILVSPYSNKYEELKDKFKEPDTDSIVRLLEENGYECKDSVSRKKSARVTDEDGWTTI